MYLVGKSIIVLLRRIFLKQIYIEGEIPQSGPILFYSSHMNCYLDTYPVISSCPYKISLILAAVSAKQKVVGTVAKFLGCIIANRPIDSAFKGAGKVFSKGNKLNGVNTEFLKELSPGRIVENNGCEVTVLSVESNTEATCSGELTKEPSDYKIQPQQDHSQMFSAVFDELTNNSPVLIMPEGRSHETPGTIKFKSGIGKIIITALEKNIPIKVYAIGMCYTYPERHRNNVTMKISKEIVFTKDKLPTDQRLAIKHITKTLETELQHQVLCLDNYQEVKFVYFAQNILFGKNFCTPKVEKWQKLGEKLKNLQKNNENRYQEILEAFNKYQEDVDALGVSKYFKESLSVFELLMNVILMILLIPFFLIAKICVWLSSFYIEYKTEEARLNLLRNITFRVSGCDTVNSSRTIYVLGFYPILVLFLAFFFYCYTSSILSTSLFCIIFPAYLLLFHNVNDRIKKAVKVVKQYTLSSQTTSHLIKSRKTLQAIINEIFS